MINWIDITQSSRTDPFFPFQSQVQSEHLLQSQGFEPLACHLSFYFGSLIEVINSIDHNLTDLIVYYDCRVLGYLQHSTLTYNDSSPLLEDLGVLIQLRQVFLYPRNRTLETWELLYVVLVI